MNVPDPDLGGEEKAFRFKQIKSHRGMHFHPSIGVEAYSVSHFSI